jgi:hypothetical protein
MGNEWLLGAHAQLLHGPRVAVGVGEAEEGAAVPFVEDRDLARLDAPLEQLLAGGPGVGDAQLCLIRRGRRRRLLAPPGGCPRPR